MQNFAFLFLVITFGVLTAWVAVNTLKYKKKAVVSGLLFVDSPLTWVLIPVLVVLYYLLTFKLL